VVSEALCFGTCDLKGIMQRVYECYVYSKEFQIFIWNALLDYYTIFLWMMVNVKVCLGNSIMLSMLTLIPLIWFGKKTM
jgi:hypothetical protein